MRATTTPTATMTTTTKTMKEEAGQEEEEGEIKGDGGFSLRSAALSLYALAFLSLFLQPWEGQRKENRKI